MKQKPRVPEETMEPPADCGDYGNPMANEGSE